MTEQIIGYNNWLRPSDPSLVQKMVCRLIGAKPLYDPMLGYYCLIIGNKVQWNLNKNTTISMQENEVKMSSAKCSGVAKLSHWSIVVRIWMGRKTSLLRFTTHRTQWCGALTVSSWRMFIKRVNFPAISHEQGVSVMYLNAALPGNGGSRSRHATEVLKVLSANSYWNQNTEIPISLITCRLWFRTECRLGAVTPVCGLNQDPGMVTLSTSFRRKATGRLITNRDQWGWNSMRKLSSLLSLCADKPLDCRSPHGLTKQIGRWNEILEPWGFTTQSSPRFVHTIYW